MNHLESSFTGKNYFWRYIIMILAVLAASNSIGAIPLFISADISSANDPDILEKLINDPNNLSVLNLNPNVYLLEMIFPFIIGLLAFILLIRPLNDRTLIKVINGTNSFRWNRFFISALIWIIVSAIYLFAWLKIDPSNFTLNNRTLTLIPLILISVFLLPFQTTFEEIIFRGYLMQGFAVLVRNRWFPLIITSILFALIHIINPEVERFGFWTMMPQYVLFGLIFGVMTILDDGIEAAMGAHAANNVFLCIFVTNEASTLQSPAIWEQHNIYPWTEFVLMLLIGAIIIFAMKIIFKWKDFSVLFGKVRPAAQIP